MRTPSITSSITLLAVAIIGAPVSANAAVMMVGSNAAYPGSQANVFSSVHYPDRPPTAHPSLFVWDPEWAPIPGAPTGSYLPKTHAELGIGTDPQKTHQEYLENSVSSYGGIYFQPSENGWGIYFSSSTRFKNYAAIYTPVLVEDATYFAGGFFVKADQWFYTHHTWYIPSTVNNPRFIWVYWFGQGWLGCFGNGWVWDASSNTFSWTTPETFPFGYQP